MSVNYLVSATRMIHREMLSEMKIFSRTDLKKRFNVDQFVWNDNFQDKVFS
jgi:hypothetical protein